MAGGYTGFAVEKGGWENKRMNQGTRAIHQAQG